MTNLRTPVIKDRISPVNGGLEVGDCGRAHVWVGEGGGLPLAAVLPPAELLQASKLKLSATDARKSVTHRSGRATKFKGEPAGEEEPCFGDGGGCGKPTLGDLCLVLTPAPTPTPIPIPAAAAAAVARGLAELLM